MDATAAPTRLVSLVSASGGHRCAARRPKPKGSHVRFLRFAANQPAEGGFRISKPPRSDDFVFKEESRGILDDVIGEKYAKMVKQ